MDETELLFTEILNCDRASLYLRKNSLVTKDKSVAIASALRRRASCEPIQYILGKAEFMGLEFKVSPDVLIPRPETELLVETATELALGPRFKVQGCKILDLGTGSGCIAISLAKSLSNVEIDAIDISDKALEIAKENARLHNVNINFIQGDLFTPCNPKSQGSDFRPAAYDLIISNPPYIASHDIDKLQPEIQYEPRIALDGGLDGLDFYRRIISKAYKYLNEDGLIMLEMGFSQRFTIEDILQNAAIYNIVDVIKDYNGIDRIIIIRKNHG